MQAKITMNILHVAYVEDSNHSGVAVAVPKHVMYQGKQANTAILNINDYQLPNISQSVFLITNYKNIAELPVPFNNPDLVVFHEIYRFPFIRLAKELRLKNVPYIIMPHGSLTNFAQHSKYAKKLLGNVLFFNKFITNANAIQFLSNSEMHLSTKYNALPHFISGNGVSVNFDSIPKTRYVSTNRLVFIGRFDIVIKGLDLLLRACIEIKDKLLASGTTIDLYGPESEQKKQFANSIQEYGLSNIIKLYPAIYGKKKESVIRKADYFILLSRSEGQPMALLEALYLGTPLIVSPGTGFMEEVQINKLGYVTRSIPEICDAITTAYDKHSYQDMSNRCTTFATKNYSWDKVAGDAVHTYMAIIAERA